MNSGPLLQEIAVCSRDRICEEVFSGEISAKAYSERRTEGCKKDEKDTEKEKRV